jgi:hypothetical protein
MRKTKPETTFLLENYLGYLNEKEYQLDPVRQPGTRSLFNPAGKVALDSAGNPIYKTTKSFGKFVQHNAVKGVRGSLVWGLLLTLGLTALWRGLNFAFSKAYRKCGFEKGPHKTVCMSRERIKILQQKIGVLNKAAAGCSKTKDPGLCKKQVRFEIQKINNRIKSNQNKIKSIMNPKQEALQAEENKEQLNEILPAIVGVAAFTGAMFATDWALQKAWRTALAIVSTASRKCGVYKTGPVRNACMARYKLVSLEQQLRVLMQMKSKCSKTKDPKKCSEEIDGKIEKTKAQIQMQKDTIVIANREAEAQKREEQMKLAKKEAAKGM